MKKILLTMVALMAMAFTASADDATPEYTVTGEVTNIESWDANNWYGAAIGTKPTVEKYADSIVIRNWCGIEDYDIAYGITSGVLYYTSSKTWELTSYYSRGYYYLDCGVAEESSTVSNPTYMYIYNTSSYIDCTITPESGEGDSKVYASGSLLVSGYSYYGTGAATTAYGYYYVTWDTTPTSGITNVTAKAENENAPMYNLAGQRVSKNAKGLVIKNGKKMILR